MPARPAAPPVPAPVPLLPILAAAVALAAAAAHFQLASGTLPFHLPLFCPFRQLSGLPCPTCGATRALAALAHGDLPAALSFNPLVAIASLLLVAAGLLSLASRALRVGIPVPRPGPARQRLLRASAAGLILANWAYLILKG
jgi:hypothetical protein